MSKMGLCDYLFMYVIFGIVTSVGMSEFITLSVPEGIAVFLLWPMFVLKYLGIGAWMVLTAGWELLV